MVAPRDYYADLELSPTAEVTEIKKQYRKLALKYHPDRNPGREQEVNAQFLIIQTAHDVLTDSQQRAKYDASRTRSGTSRFPGASGVRGNPWADVGQQFPTPPRRNPAPRNAASGAERWNSRFSSGVPPTARQHTAANPESKKNAAKAFENMKPKAQTKSSSGSGARPSGVPPPTPPRTESARQRQQASFGARKTGYHPRASAAGDEPPVINSNYSTRPDPPPRSNPMSADPAMPQKVKPERMPDPLSQFRDNSASDARQRSPYMANTGERTNPFDVNSGQPSSTSTANASQSSNSKNYAPSGANEPAAHHNDAKPNDHSKPATSDKSSSKLQANGSQKPSIFNISDDDDFAKTSSERRYFAKSSIDDINTSFVNDDGRAAWQFNAGGAEQTSPTNPPTQPAEQDGERSSTKPAGTWTQPTDGPFNANGWSDQFGPQTFVPPQRTNSSGSPPRTTRTNSRKPKATKPVPGEPGQNAILVDDSSDEEAFTWRGRKGQTTGASTDGPQAMDIDSPPAEPAPEAPQPNGARNIHVEPSRPEWRPGDFAGVDSTKDKAPEKKEPVKPNTGGSEDSDEFKASFADLRNVAPFATAGTGLKSFADLKDTLPFESKPSDEIPIEPKVSAPKPLDFPTVPQAPRPPLTMGVPNMKTNIPTWDKYVQEFEDYMRRWDKFVGEVTDHFSTRRARIATHREEKGYGFLRARGDTDYSDYLQSVQQDNDVRRRWMAAFDDHEQRLQEFKSFREKMK